MFDFKNATWEESKGEYQKIAQEIGDDQFFTKKELKYLPEVLQEGEQVLAFSSGAMNGNTWLITLTDKRIIFLDKGMIYGLKQEIIPLSKVNSISGKTGMLLGQIAISDGAGERIIKNVWKKTVAPFTSKALSAIDALGTKTNYNNSSDVSNDIISKLERLANLRDRGILSEEEFKDEKHKILSN